VTFPEEVWTWSKYDTFVLAEIHFLLDDEFLDGELADELIHHTCNYKILKDCRKQLKLILNTRSFKSQGEAWARTLPGPLYYLYHLAKEVDKYSEVRYIQAIGILNQTRGVGKPPPLVTLQSKKKFLDTVRIPPQPFSKTMKGLVDCALVKVDLSIPEEVFTGLTTKARIQVLTTACLEKTRQEFGTLATISEMVQRGLTGARVPIMDLETGIVTERRTLTQCTTGEYVFWASLDHCLHTSPDELRNVFVTVVKEPGKSRTVTKSMAAVKIVLDLVHRICAYPLTKLESSESGMGKSSHAWEFFKSFFKEGIKEHVFDINKKTETKLEDSTLEEISFKSIFVSSTDYETATDFLQFDIAERLANFWMSKCGIPKVLQGFVNCISFRSRNIYFQATNLLGDIGEPTDKPGVRRIRSVRGILMGDPMTKIILHLVNIVAREIGKNLPSEDFSKYRFHNSFEIMRTT